jgi:hypothetical protein
VRVALAAELVLAPVPAPRDMECRIELARSKYSWLDTRPHRVRPAHP